MCICREFNLRNENWNEFILEFLSFACVVSLFTHLSVYTIQDLDTVNVED